MKRTILLLTAGLIVSQSYSQTQKGYWMLGTSFGSAGFSSTNSNSSYSNSATEYNSDGKSFGVSVNPSGLYFIKDNLAVGAAVGMSFSTSKGDYSNTGSANVSKTKSHYTNFSFGPQIRYYFGTPGSKGQPWVETSAGISTNPGKSENTNTMIASGYENDSRSNNWNAGANLGYSHFINSSIGLQYFIGYRHYHYSSNTDVKPNPGAAYSYETTSNTNNINFGVGLQIHIPSASVKNKNK